MVTQPAGRTTIPLYAIFDNDAEAVAHIVCLRARPLRLLAGPRRNAARFTAWPEDGSNNPAAASRAAL